jgi:hypothetical protein
MINSNMKFFSNQPLKELNLKLTLTNITTIFATSIDFLKIILIN